MTSVIFFHGSRNRHPKVRSGQRCFFFVLNGARPFLSIEKLSFRGMPFSSSPVSYVEKEPSPPHGWTHDQIREHGSQINDSAVCTFSVGLRVVRGTELPSSDNESDGDEGIVGTVVQVGSNSSSVAENSVTIQWDIGSRAIYGTGYHGQYDICVLDNSSIGKETTLFLAVDY